MYFFLSLKFIMLSIAREKPYHTPITIFSKVLFLLLSAQSYLMQLFSILAAIQEKPAQSGQAISAPY